MLVEFHPSASQELEAASSFYEGRRPGLGEELADEIEDVCVLLSEYPAIGRNVDEAHRTFRSEGFHLFCSAGFARTLCKSLLSHTSASALGIGVVAGYC